MFSHSNKALFVGAALAVALPVHAATYTLTSGSSITLVNGTISTSLSGSFSGFPVSGSGSGVIAEQGPGSLTTSLSGTLDAIISGSDISLVTSLVAGNSGNWLPSGDPANIGIQSIFGLDFTAPFPDTTVTVLGSVNGVAGSVSGMSTLVGPAGNQTFGLSGLVPAFSSGTADVVATPASTYPAFSMNDIPLSSFVFQFNGSGSLTTVGGIETVTIPFSMDSVYNLVAPIPGYSINATVMASLHREGVIIATRPVPEPETYAMMLAGLGLVGLSVVRRRASLI